MKSRPTLGTSRAMPSPIDPELSPVRAADLLEQGRSEERAGNVIGAQRAYESALQLAEAQRDQGLVAQVLRHLALNYHHRGDSAHARELCTRSYNVAMGVGDRTLAAFALNSLAGITLDQGQVAAAARTFRQALVLASGNLELLARIEQNLGILATMQGEHDAALVHYGRSLDAFRALGDERGCALAYHNLGMISVDQGKWEEADECFQSAFAGAERSGDVRLQGLCLLNHAEVHVARQAFDLARADVERALGIFDQLEASFDKADAYRMLGVVYRGLGQLDLAERHLDRSSALAAEAGSVLSQAEASRELALLYQQVGRNLESLVALNTAYRLFRQLNARTELIDVGAKIADLEGAYMRVVHQWGQSLESADAYTHGHCERVASFGVAVGRALGLDAEALTALRLGAYLHDLGKVRIPDQILNKTDKLTEEEFAIVKMHPVWGLEMLSEVDFPWDLKPIIRWHHEKYDGSGYPDGLRGDDIPVAAQIICIVDVYDALTTNRSYKPAYSPAEALGRMAVVPQWWRPDVYRAFLEAVGEPEVRRHEAGRWISDQTLGQAAA
jgi:putative nucleotidyltransferase with HDIG domain